MQAFSQESGEQLACFVAVQAMQIDFILNDPAPPSQITQNGLGQTSAQVMRLIATFQAVLQADMAVKTFMQRCSLVGNVLQWAGWGWAGTVLNDIGRGKRLDAGHSGTKRRVVRIERFALLCVFCRAGSVPVGWQTIVASFFRCWWALFNARWPNNDGPFRFGQMHTIGRRQWLDIGHRRLEGSKVFRVDQASQAWSRLSR